eukprot:423345-Rhodomonas_salina.1
MESVKDAMGVGEEEDGSDADFQARAGTCSSRDSSYVVIILLYVAITLNPSPLNPKTQTQKP